MASQSKQTGKSLEYLKGSSVTNPSCLKRNNSTANAGEQKLRGAAGHRKSSAALRFNVEYLCRRHGLDRIGFLTLTFPDHVTDMHEAQRRYNSFATHSIRKRKVDAISVVHRHKTGKIHFHVVIAENCDIRTNERALNEAQKNWRKQAGRHGFGIMEFQPIRTTAEKVAGYVAHYIDEHIGNRRPEDKGARLVRYTKNTNAWSNRFSWNNVTGRLWRLKLAALCRCLGLTSDNYIEVFTEWLGPKSFHFLTTAIKSIRLQTYPSAEHALKDGKTVPPGYETGPITYNDGEFKKTVAAACKIALAERNRRASSKR